jgi:hypothetical protein
MTEMDGVVHRISYADLDVVEVGAIYESLLENIPRITDAPQSINKVVYGANSFILDPRALTRKTTGSYYTQQALIQELIRSALEPIINDRLQRADDQQALESALLSIRICDPACGSGAFLISACNHLSERLARIRSTDSILTEDLIQQARRDILQHCIYGVDLNPMAIELVKVSLWINALVKDKPLNFLDHHLKCGNSVVGATPKLMASGIPCEAFDPVEGDNKNIANHIKKLNHIQLQNESLSNWLDLDALPPIDGTEFKALSDITEIDPRDVELKNVRYSHLIQSDSYKAARFLADLWTSSFFWPLLEDRQVVPTQGIFSGTGNNESRYVDSELKDKVQALAKTYSFFHWPYEFPEVFRGTNPGFDCVLGNPPWERIKTQRKEFFFVKAPEIVKAKTASERKEMIRDLVRVNPALDAEFRQTKRASECERKFFQNSFRFPLTGKGYINSYSIFAEHARQTICRDGRVGIIVPTGIATDETTGDFFGDIINHENLVSLFDFENRQKIFPIDSRFKFCLLTVGGNDAPIERFDIAFFLHEIADISNPERRFELSREDIHLISPNTRSCPLFRNKRDAEIVKSIYKKIPILKNEQTGQNPWSISIRRVFNMSDDSNLFREAASLREDGFSLNGNTYRNQESVYLPLYEGKMIWIYNHRFRSTIPQQGKSNEEDEFNESSKTQLADCSFFALPRYWIARQHVLPYLPSKQNYFIGFRKVTNVTNKRTAVFSLVPPIAVGESIHLLLFSDRIGGLEKAGLLANMNTMVFDYVVRQKLGGTNLTHFFLKQLPVLPPSIYTKEIIDLIFPKVLELCYTAWDVSGFAKETGYVSTNDGQPNSPYTWDEERRAHLQAELDAIYAHLYGISQEDLDYILDTFPIVRRQDEQKYGTYLTKELILNYYDQYTGRFLAVDELISYG